MWKKKFPLNFCALKNWSFTICLDLRRESKAIYFSHISKNTFKANYVYVKERTRNKCKRDKTTNVILKLSDFNSNFLNEHRVKQEIFAYLPCSLKRKAI